MRERRTERKIVPAPFQHYLAGCWLGNAASDAHLWLSSLQPAWSCFNQSDSRTVNTHCPAPFPPCPPYFCVSFSLFIEKHNCCLHVRSLSVAVCLIQVLCFLLVVYVGFSSLVSLSLFLFVFISSCYFCSQCSLFQVYNKNTFFYNPNIFLIPSFVSPPVRFYNVLCLSAIWIVKWCSCIPVAQTWPPSIIFPLVITEYCH